MSAAGNHPRPAHSSAWPGPARVLRPSAGGGRWRILSAVLARCHGGALDRQLAAGAIAIPGELIARRARQLTSGHNRRRLAAGLERALRDCAADDPVFTSVVKPNRREVVGARVVIGALERRLRDGEPIQARGAAMLQVLLTDGNGPLYAPVEPGSLGSELRAAAAALEPGLR